MLSKELIDRFMLNECTDEERTTVLNYFNEHPEEWDVYFNKEDWQQSSHGKGDLLPPSKKMKRVIDWQVRQKPVLVRATGLAAIFILAAAAWILYRQPGKDHQLAGTTKQTPQTVLRRQTNPTKNTIAILLRDSTLVELASGSSIEYPDPLVADGKRLVTLTGKAVFHVAKDPENPFVVLSGGIATTVLGTVFRVDMTSTVGFVTVTLLEGKIVVRPADSAVKNTFQPAWLSPGDRLVYDRTSGTALVYRNSLNTEKLVKASYKSKKMATGAKPDWYSFEGERLPEILNQLSAYFQVDIYYYPSQLNNKYFTGKLLKGDSLDSILTDIALLNHLSVKKADGSYTITLKSP